MFQVEVLKRAIALETNPGEESTVDRVLKSFVETMFEPMIKRYSLYPAKGTTVRWFAHNADQMMLPHLLNGIFPTLNWVKVAQKYQPQTWRTVGELELKIYILAYSMHDLDKLLKRDGLDTTDAVKTAEIYGLVKQELNMLGARQFLPEFEDWLSVISWLVVNTQRSRGANLSDTYFLPSNIEEELESRVQPLNKGVKDTLRDLCTLSDLIAFGLKSPEDILVSSMARTGRQDGIAYIMGNYGNFRLVYHKLTEVRGLLSNLINNATMRYMQFIFGPDQPPLIPYLFFPNGVVYLDPLKRTLPEIDRKALAEKVIQEIREACSDVIEEGQGLGFDEKGLLRPPSYVYDFLSISKFFYLFSEKTWLLTKANVAESPLQKIREMQRLGRIPVDIKTDYEANERIAAMGRFLINYTKQANKHLEQSRAVILERNLATRLGEVNWQTAKQIPSSGGVDYRFYWLAARYLEEHPISPDELKELFDQLIEELLAVGGPELEKAPGLQGSYMAHLPSYLEQNLSFGWTDSRSVVAPAIRYKVADWSAELERYINAKKPRDSRLACTICNSAYPTDFQEDSAVLFQPWVYKNRLPLYKGKNAGGICVICSLELMLRQILLTDKPPRRRKKPVSEGANDGRIRVTGKKYEGLELKYFFLYPAFFFTTQTARLAYLLINRLENLRLFELRARLANLDMLETEDILNLSFFNPSQADFSDFDADEAEDKETRGSMYLLNRNEEHHYPGFVFFAKKTFSREKTEAAATTASWVEAAWLGLALPLITGTRVVVSEMYLPLFNSSADFKETVVLDAPHLAVRHLLRLEADPGAQTVEYGAVPSFSVSLRLNELYGSLEERVKDVTKQHRVGGKMAAFSRALEVHIDTEAGQGDLRLGRFNRIAREIATDKLWVFAFLQERVRAQGLDSMPLDWAHHYVKIFEELGGDMTRHRQIVELYLDFYSPFSATGGGKYPSSRAIVQPVDIAARRIINDTLNLSAEEIKLETRQELQAWLDRVRRGEATGRVTAHKGDEEMLRVRAFVDTFYKEVFEGYAEGQRSLLASRLNRFKNGCEAAFSDIMWEKRQARQQAGQSAEDLPDPAAPREGEGETTAEEETEAVS